MRYLYWNKSIIMVLMLFISAIYIGNKAYAGDEGFESKKNGWIKNVVANIELSAEEHGAIYFINAEVNDESRNALANARINIARQYALLFGKTNSEDALLIALKYAHSSSTIGTKPYFLDYLDFLQKQLAVFRYSQAIDLIKANKDKIKTIGHETAKAIILVEDAVELDPDKAAYWKLLVNLYQPFRDDFSIKIDIRKALKQLSFLEINNETHHLDLLSILIQLNLTKELVYEFEWLVEKGSAKSKKIVLPKLTLLYVDKGLMQQGIEFYALQINKNPKLKKDILLAQAILHQAQGQSDKANNLLDELLKKYGDNKDIKKYRDLWRTRHDV